MTLAALLVVLAAVSPSPSWAAAYTGQHRVSVPAGQTVDVVFPAPERLVKPARPLTFAWTLTPVGPGVFLFIEICNGPARCAVINMRPTGDGSGQTGVPVRVLNRGPRSADIVFRYTIWEAR